MKTETLYRTSAVIYADSNLDSRKTETIRRKFVESVFVEKQNAKLTIQEIGVEVESYLEIYLDDMEISNIVKNNDFFIEELGPSKMQNKYNLKPERYNHLHNKSQDTIENVVNRYLLVIKDTTNTPDSIRELLNRYLYALMNTNIIAYSQVINPSSQNRERTNGRIEYSTFSEKEIDIINGFLSWKDTEKDKELFKLISCCIEYAIAINNAKENALIESFRNKVFYIDNALIYRAIGINGETRKQRTLSFIRKCRESGQSLRISKYSYKEFRNTIEFHLTQLNKTTPFGKINPHIFQLYSYGEGFYQFYHTWRGNRSTYSFEIFKNFILSEYDSLLKMYDIKEDYQVPFDENDASDVIDQYTNEIMSVKKGRGHKDLHIADAKNMYWIECSRNGKDGRLTDTKYYFVTSDQKLQQWDYHHSRNQPITLLPSQWMALLLKYYSRTNDDYKSFVSFLSIPQDESALSPEDLQDILAGISQTTEDFAKQQLIVDTFLLTDWEKQFQSSNIREKAKAYAKEKLEEQFVQQIEAREREHSQELCSIKNDAQIQIQSIKEVFRKQIEEIEVKSKRDRLNNISQQLQEMEIRKSNIDNQLRSYMRNLKVCLIIVAVLLFAVWIWLLIRLGADKLEIPSVVLGLLGIILPCLYCVYYEKAFSLERTMQYFRLKKEKEYKQKYLYSDAQYEELVRQKEDLCRELESNA
ncbi:MAG: hypothetical protein SOX36_01155 [Candidatus Cryptobacteroides sp.]|nr:hypothetical protein [Candidatus Cryptobacteroides sp.]